MLQHIHQRLFAIALVDKWLLLLDDLEAFVERLLSVVLRHICRELFHVTGSNVDHLVSFLVLLRACGHLKLIHEIRQRLVILVLIIGDWLGRDNHWFGFHYLLLLLHLRLLFLARITCPYLTSILSKSIAEELRVLILVLIHFWWLVPVHLLLFLLLQG